MIAAMLEASVNRFFVCLSVLLLLSSWGCNRKPVNSSESFTADILMDGSSFGAPRLHGHLMLGKDRLLLDWGVLVESFDLKKRTGWRALPNSRVYQEAADKDLSTYAPLMTNGSMCPSTQVPSACRLIGKEEIGGRMAKKWDVWNPKGFHVYYWTDDALDITLRCEIGESKYEVKHLREGFVWDAAFDLPAGYQRVQDITKPSTW